MARGSTNRPGGTSRIRLFMFEGDLQEGELAQVTQALQNAFRSGQTQSARPAMARLSGSQASEQADIAQGEIFEGEHAELEDVTPSPSPRQGRKPRPAKVPTVLSDIDIKADPNLKDFVADYDVKTNIDRYLVIALWFRDARALNGITVDHVYTCFRLLGWSTTMTDFAKPLKNLRAEQSMIGGSKGYSLTLTGAGKIEAKKRTTA